MYNPITICRNATKWLEGGATDTRIIKWEEIYHSLDYHGEMSGLSEKEIRESIRETDNQANDIMKSAKFGIITFGSAWVYRWKEDGKIVANCHKIPADKFEKEILSKEEIVDEWSDLLRVWKMANPEIKVILTVSPVRHIRDGLVDNQRSKATLVLAVSELVDRFDYVEYFPSYEIMVDELRDYRFYTEDLVHPNSMAVEYVMSTFSSCYFSSEMDRMSKELKALRKSLEHRPFFPQTNSYRAHLEKTQQKLNGMIKDFPGLDWLNEEKKIAALWDQAMRST